MRAQSINPVEKSSRVTFAGHLGGMIKLTILLTRRADLSHREFIDYWKNRHAPLLLGLPDFTAIVRRYLQQHPTDDPPAGLPMASYDGIAELWFDDLDSLRGGLASEMYKSVVADDEENFLDRAKTVMMISSEVPIA